MFVVVDYTSSSSPIDFSLQDNIDNYDKDQRLSWLTVSITVVLVPIG